MTPREGGDIKPHMTASAPDARAFAGEGEKF